MSRNLQQLVKFCKSESIPMNSYCHKTLKNLVSCISNDDVFGMRPFPIRESYKNEPVLYNHIYEDDFISVGIFIVPPSGKIPLHDHPGMSVYSKLLFGQLYITDYSPVNDDEINIPVLNNAENEESKYKTVKMNRKEVIQAGETFELDEVHGNFHEIAAGELEGGCAFLDVITPPYSESRGITYFTAEPIISSTKNVNTTTTSTSTTEEKEMDLYYRLKPNYGDFDGFRCVSNQNLEYLTK